MGLILLIWHEYTAGVYATYCVFVLMLIVMLMILNYSNRGI